MNELLEQYKGNNVLVFTAGIGGQFEGTIVHVYNDVVVLHQERDDGILRRLFGVAISKIIAVKVDFE